MPTWTLRTLSGQARSLADLPAEYVAVFAAEGCGPCHTLFARLAHEGRPAGRLVVLAEGDAGRLATVAQTQGVPLYDEFLSGVTRPMMLEFEIPSTPYAVAVRHGHVIAAGPSRTGDELTRIAEALHPMTDGQPAPA
jgi:hypothetical protein